MTVDNQGRRHGFLSGGRIVRSVQRCQFLKMIGGRMLNLLFLIPFLPCNAIGPMLKYKIIGPRTTPKVYKVTPMEVWPTYPQNTQKSEKTPDLGHFIFESRGDVPSQHFHCGDASPPFPAFDAHDDNTH